MSLQSFLGFSVAVLAQVVSLSRLALTFPGLVAVISNRAYALVRHSPLLTGSTDAGAPSKLGRRERTGMPLVPS